MPACGRATETLLSNIEGYVTLLTQAPGFQQRTAPAVGGRQRRRDEAAGGRSSKGLLPQQPSAASANSAAEPGHDPAR